MWFTWRNSFSRVITKKVSIWAIMKIRILQYTGLNLVLFFVVIFTHIVNLQIVE